jgi:hypothetical protein
MSWGRTMIERSRVIVDPRRPGEDDRRPAYLAAKSIAR